MLIQAEDKRLSSHEETLEQHGGKTDLFGGANVTAEERRQMKGKRRESEEKAEGADRRAGLF